MGWPKKKRKKEEPIQDHNDGSDASDNEEEEVVESEDDEYLQLLSSIQHPLAQVSLIHGPEEHLSKADFSSVFKEPLQASKKTVQGQLSNGFKYVITPNKIPPRRFEAHLQVHTGSIHEQEHEQGLAHFLEHCVFLGTEKYPTADIIRNIMAGWGMSFGGDTNAYTDFRNTVYTFHVPLSDSSDMKEQVPDHQQIRNALDVLFELMFRAKLQSHITDNERKAVLSELQIMNTVEYRSEFTKFQQLHGNNILSKRFPIGKEEMINSFTEADLRKFYETHYRPDNMTLHICGDLEVESTIESIQLLFQQIQRPTLVQVPIGNQEVLSSIPSTPFLNNNNEVGSKALLDLRPPTEFLTIFQHQLVNQFSLQINMSFPMRPVTKMEDVHDDMITNIIGLAIAARVYHLEQSFADPPFTEISWEYYDSWRENRIASDYTISSHINDWKDAVTVGIKELLRLVTYGLTEGELREHLGTLLKDAHTEAEQDETQASEDRVDEILSDINLGWTIVDRKQSFSNQMKLANSVTLSDVNNRIKSLFPHVLNMTTRPLTEEPHLSIFVCIPTKYEKKKIKLTKTELIQVIEEALKFVEPLTMEEMPQQLVDPKELEMKKQHTKYVPPLDKRSSIVNETTSQDGYTLPYTAVPEMGIVLKRLQNGIAVAMKRTTFEKRQCSLRIFARGGRSVETAETRGACTLGLRTFIDGGAGGFSSKQLSKYCAYHGVYMDFNVGMESIALDLLFSVSHDGMKHAFELAHLFLTQPDFDPKAFARAQKNSIIDVNKIEKDVESIAFDNLIKASLGVFDKRFIFATKPDFEKLTVEQAKKVILMQLQPHNMELCLVGDFEPAVAEDFIQTYFGTLVTTDNNTGLASIETHVPFKSTPDHMFASIQDDNERAVMYLAFKCCNKWGVCGQDSKPPTDPLRDSRILGVLAKIISNRMYNVIREKKGLTYDISCDCILYDWFDGGLFVVNLSPFVSKIEETKQAVLEVLQDFKAKHITQEEFDEAVFPMAKWLISSMNSSNLFWVSVLATLQNPTTPKDLTCFSSMTQFYPNLKPTDLHDVIDKYFSLDVIWSSVAVTQTSAETT